MPNQRRRNKKNGSHFTRTGTGSAPKVRSVKDLLGRTVPVLAPISDQAARQGVFRQWLAQRLPAGLTEHITGVVERDSTLVIFTESAGWSVRLRYAVAEIEEELRRDYPDVTRIAVRVMPASGKPRS